MIRRICTRLIPLCSSPHSPASFREWRMFARTIYSGGIALSSVASIDVLVTQFLM